MWMALHGVQTVCSDLVNASETALPLHQRYQVTSKITYRDIDACAIPYENEFDLIVFKSIIGGIGRGNDINRQEAVFRSIHKALKPGGQLLFAENLIASTLHRFLRQRFVKWGNDWRYISMEEMKGFLAPFSRYDLKSTGVAAAFGRSEKQRNLLAIADNLFLNHLCPESWKYIAYGIATK